MPTPIKAATRPIPEATTIAKVRRHGAMIRANCASVVTQPTCAAAALSAAGASGPSSAPVSVAAALADDGAVALRQLQDELVRVGVARCRFELGLARRRLAEPQIVLDRAMEQVGVLVHDRDLAAHRLRVEAAQIAATDAHRAR